MMNHLNEDTYRDAVRSQVFTKRMLKNAQTKKLQSIPYWMRRVRNATMRVNALKHHSSAKKKQAIASTTHNDRHNSPPKNQSLLKTFASEFSDHATTTALVKHGQHLAHDVGKALRLIKGSSARKTKFFRHINNVVRGLKTVVGNVGEIIGDTIGQFKTTFSPEELEILQKNPESIRERLGKKLTPKQLNSLKLTGHTAAGVSVAYLLGSYGSYLGKSSVELIDFAREASNGSRIFEAAIHHLPTELQHHVQHAGVEAGMLTAIHAIKHALRLEAVDQSHMGVDDLLVQLIELYSPVFESSRGQMALLKGFHEVLHG